MCVPIDTRKTKSLVTIHSHKRLGWLIASSSLTDVFHPNIMTFTHRKTSCTDHQTYTYGSVRHRLHLVCGAQYWLGVFDCAVCSMDTALHLLRPVREHPICLCASTRVDPGAQTNQLSVLCPFLGYSISCMRLEIFFHKSSLGAQLGFRRLVNL